jgi:hypothetical protein
VAKIQASPSSLSYSATTGGPNPSDQSLEIWNGTTGTTLNYSLAEDAAWLDVNPKSGSSSGEKKPHAVAIDVSGLAEGNYSTAITVTDPKASNSPQSISVSLAVAKPAAALITISPSSLSFQATTGGSNPPSQTINIKNSGGGTLNYTLTDDAGWLDVDPKSGMSTGSDVPHAVSVDSRSLAAGNYSGTITVTDPKASNSPQTVAVTLALAKGPESKICVLPATLIFAAKEGGLSPAPQEIEVWNCGDAGTILNYAISDDASWLDVSPPGGSSTGSKNKHMVQVNVSGMKAGNYGATISVSDPNCSNSPQNVTVILALT